MKQVILLILFKILQGVTVEEAIARLELATRRVRECSGENGERIWGTEGDYYLKKMKTERKKIYAEHP